MKTKEFNMLSLEEKKDLLWDPDGKAKFCETYFDCVKYEKIGIYILDDIIVSVYYGTDKNDIVDIKAWGKYVEKRKLLENVA